MKKSIGKKLILGIVGVFLCVVLHNDVAHAFWPDQAYVHYANEAVHSPNVYQVDIIIDEKVMGCGALNGAQDIFMDSKDQCYILDSGNCRVVILNSDYRCIKQLKEFNYKGEVLTLAPGAQGIFYHENSGYLYITDTENDRILKSNLNGVVQNVFDKPVSELFDSNLSYKPRKIIVDNMGLMYVTSANINTGALLIDQDNTFLGFYGINKIKSTVEVLLEYWWRSILTDAQNAQSNYSFQPTEFNNLFWSNDRFVYAVSPTSKTVSSPVVKLNAIGNNVFPANDGFGDGQDQGHMFCDITVDNEGVFTVLDNITGKLYQYDKNCNLLAIFGGRGGQKGLFNTPISIEANSQNDILIVDAYKNTVTVMTPTYYGEKLRKAVSLYNEGLYEEAIEPWNEVLSLNANYRLAYVSLGKAYLSLGEYEEAKEYFKLGLDQEDYAKAKVALRGEVLRENFALIAGVVIVFMILFLGGGFWTKQWKRIRKIKSKEGGA